MPKLSDLFIEAGVIPNHIRCIEINTQESYIIESVSHYRIAFTFDSVPHISKLSEYTNLEAFATKLVENETGENQAVIEVTGKGLNGELTGFIYLYRMISNDGKIIGSHKKKTFIIPNDLENPKGTMSTTQERTRTLLG